VEAEGVAEEGSRGARGGRKKGEGSRGAREQVEEGRGSRKKVESIRELYRIGVGPSSKHAMGPRRAAEILRERWPQAAS
jgi:hypothetical protein